MRSLTDMEPGRLYAPLIEAGIAQEPLSNELLEQAKDAIKDIEANMLPIVFGVAAIGNLLSKQNNSDNEPIEPDVLGDIGFLLEFLGKNAETLHSHYGIITSALIGHYKLTGALKASSKGQGFDKQKKAPEMP